MLHLLAILCQDMFLFIPSFLVIRYLKLGLCLRIRSFFFFFSFFLAWAYTTH
ncbi:hypothetical protein QBC43DRAFT_310681, partial [Cladorrhinum sp. PSN259]